MPFKYDLMAFLKSSPLTFTGVPRLPEDTVQLCNNSQEVVLGDAVGTLVGEADGLTVGCSVGDGVGTLVGKGVGPSVGCSVGIVVGDLVGKTVGLTVGC